MLYLPLTTKKGIRYLDIEEFIANKEKQQQDQQIKLSEFDFNYNNFDINDDDIDKLKWKIKDVKRKIKINELTYKGNKIKFYKTTNVGKIDTNRYSFENINKEDYTKLVLLYSKLEKAIYSYYRNAFIIPLLNQFLKGSKKL